MRARVALLALAAGCVVAADTIASRSAASSPGTALLLQAAGAQLVWLGAAFAVAALRKSVGAVEALGLGPSRLPAARAAVALVGLVALSLALHLLLRAFALRDSGSLGEIDSALSAAWPAHADLVLFAFVVGPAVAEETLFRGALLGAAVQRFGERAGVALATGLFAAAHLDPVHAAAVALPGLYLAVLVRRAGSIRPAVACHLANNGLAVAAGLVAWPELPIPSALAIAVGLAVTAASLACWLRRPR